ncbi:hypothetical protein IT408_02810 [Candidatus Uhrbacteria bacterium]|nr:hypothetical protein [Candidatus Uhrbacteria bacterium]
MQITVFWKHASLYILSFAFLLVLGAGCTSPQEIKTVSPDVATGPKNASFEDVPPAEATKKLVLTPGSVIVLKQSFHDIGETLAAGMNLGKSVERILTIRNFAPGNFANIEWKAVTEVQKDNKTENRQLVGSISGIGLKDGRELALPALWTEGIRNAGGYSAIWLPAEVFENFSKAQSSTFVPGLVSAQLVDLFDPPKTIKDQIIKLRAALEAEIKNKDIEYATSEIEHGRKDVNVNGSRVTVEVLNISSWYGKFSVLNNEQNPIVLKFTPSKELEAKGMSGFFGFEVTDFKDIQE